MDITKKLGASVSADPGVQWLCTNGHGVTHVISDAQYQQMLHDSQLSDGAKNSYRQYTFEKIDGSAVVSGSEPDNSTAAAGADKDPKAAKGKKNDTDQ